MDPNKKSSVDSLTQVLDQITIYNAEDLATGKDLGAINFLSGKYLFEQAIQLAKEFRSLPLDLLPNQTLGQLRSPVQQLGNALKKVADFTLVGQQNPEGQRNSILQEVQRFYDEAFLALTPHLAYLSLKSAEVQETMRRSKELLIDTQKKVADDLKEVAQMKKDLDGIVQAARDAASKIGVAQFATKFEELSTEHDGHSENWLKATIGLAVSTVLAAVGLLLLLPPLTDMSDPSTIQRIITKLIVISILYYGALWASRNYRAHRHLAVVNKHRQSALSTFETFVNAAADQQTKNAVLLEATHCIFSPAVSGYLGADEENPSNRVIEILKTVSSGATK
ncbi:MAG: hypothetical protein NWE98_11065 [Candidatus Bathyarchaeota archaeon]|nr:hypothetical protein [Candidatus Bathyarchaeota archaeon]